jgi:hypothetical protein
MSEDMEKFRLVFFRDKIGMEVLSAILKLCHHGEIINPDNVVMMSEYNIGVVMLQILGVYDVAPAGNGRQIVKNMFDVENALAGVSSKGE